MRKISLIAFVIAILCGCKGFYKTPKKEVYVRVANTGTIPTTGYKINEHSFAGLKPGDTTAYQLLNKLNVGDEITVILDTIMVSHGIDDCNDCGITSKKVTVGIEVVPKERTEYKKWPLIKVGFYPDDKK